MFQMTGAGEFCSLRWSTTDSSTEMVWCYFKLCFVVCVCVYCVCVSVRESMCLLTHTHTTVHVWQTKDNFVEPVLSYFGMGFSN